MPYLVSDLIADAMGDIGCISPGQTPSSDEYALGLRTGNQILSTWSREGRIVYTRAVGSFALGLAVSAYTLGAGGSWATTARPAGVDRGALASSGNFQQGVDVMPMAEFLRSIANGIGMTAALPSKMGLDDAAPLRNVRVWPTPNQAAIIQVPYWVPLAAFAAVTDAISFPVPGYEMALRTELAVTLAPSFGRPVAVELAGNMQRFLGRLQETNAAIEQQPATRQTQQ